VATTARLRLEPMGPEHVHELAMLLADPEVARWLIPPGAAPHDQDWVRWRLELSRDEWSAGSGLWIAYERESGEFVGRGGLKPLTVEGEAAYEVGWAVLPAYWGQGYATEIGAAGLARGFDELGLEQVVSMTLPDNARSLAVMARLGLTYRRDVEHAGLRHVLHAIDRADWSGEPAAGPVSPPAAR
jgi:RimJ/RimL family protein N-acetyltransferase